MNLVILPVTAEENTTANITATPTPHQTITQENRTILWIDELPLNTQSQCPIVYYGEIVNIWNRIGWADSGGNYALDYFYYNHTCGARRADIIVDIARPKLVPITRDTFPYPGIYYQHQLEGEHICSPVLEVRDGTRLVNETKEYLKQENETSPVVYDPWPEIPDKTSGADYLTARYQPINLTSTSARWYWLFHKSENIYQLQQDGDQLGNSDGLKAATYDLYLQWAGGNDLIGVFWYPEEKKIRCACLPERYVKEQPQLSLYLEKELVTALTNGNCSDDMWEQRTLKVEDPYVWVDDLFWGFNQTENNTLYVQGYSNMEPGTQINLTIAADKLTDSTGAYSLRAHTTLTELYGDWNGNYRKFRAKVPYEDSELRPGNNTLTITGPYGVRTQTDFKVNEMPAGTPPPPMYQKYINNTQWYPTPTPEIVVQKETVVQTVVQVETVIVNVTPPYEQIAKAQNDAIWSVVSTIWVIFFGIISAIVIGYLISVVVRAWRRK